MSSETYSYLYEQILEKGALDIYTEGIFMKKAIGILQIVSGAALLAAGVLTIVEGSARRSARVRHGRGVRF